MGQPFVGEIRMFAGNFPPSGWATCDGQLMAISENEALFTLIGTTYGGDGQTTFALPSLTARVPLHMGNGGATTYVIGQNGGVTSVALTINQLPAHSHSVVADGNSATGGNPVNTFPAASAPTLAYSVPNSSGNPGPPVFRNLNASTLPQQGGNQPHDNLQPYLAVNFIISLFGVFPSQN
jgi:microcystin-dependent protein